MKAQKISTDQTYEYIDEDWRELMRMSEDMDVACIVCLDATTSRGYLTAYMDGKSCQYDPVTSRFI